MEFAEEKEQLQLRIEPVSISANLTKSKNELHINELFAHRAEKLFPDQKMS